MTPALSASLEALAAMMAQARDPWWVIASAAMALHGAEVTVGDIDLLATPADGAMLIDRHGFVPIDAAPSPRFRSRLYARHTATLVPIELMADFDVCGPAGWHPLRPATRLYRPAGDALIPVPALSELIDHCHRYGRPKDRERAAILQRLPR